MGDFQAFSFRGCFEGTFATSSEKISAAVGEHGANVPDDVRAVQELLNGVPVSAGGPQPRLVVDGKAGPLTKAAIRRFQGKHLGWSDGRVDPTGPTFEKLRAQNHAGTGHNFNSQHAPAPAAPAANHDTILRLSLAIYVVPQARQALQRAQLDLDMVALKISKDRLKLGDLFHGGGREQTAARIFHQHFGGQNLPPDQILNSLNFVRTTIGGMRTVLDNPRPSVFGGGIFGRAAIIDIDPLTAEQRRRSGLRRDALAYVVLKARFRQDPARFQKLGVTPAKIYFTDGIDGRSQDYYEFTVIHEMAHFVDKEGIAAVGDHAYGFEPAYFTLPHEKRIHNADSYSCYVFETALGNARLAAIYPNLRVIEIDPVVIS